MAVDTTLTDIGVSISGGADELIATFGQAAASVTPPGELAFEEVDYLDAPDLAQLARKLIDRHQRFTPLTGVTILYCWKAKGGESGGNATLGMCQKAGGLLRHYAETDFVIWLAADHIRERELSSRQIEAILFHELCHIGFHPKTAKPIIRNHDWAGFRAEIDEYGLYLDDIRAMGKAIQQQLPGVG